MTDHIRMENINPPTTWKAVVCGGLRDVAASLDRLSDVVRDKDFS